MVTLTTVYKLYRGKLHTYSDYDKCFGKIIKRYGWDMLDQVMDTLSLDNLQVIEKTKEQLELKLND